MSILRTTLSGVAMLALSSPAMAVVCTSENSPREMTLTPDGNQASVSCAAVGSSDDAGAGMPNNKAFHKSLGLSRIEKLEDGTSDGQLFSVDGLGATEGGVAIDSGVYDDYGDVHLSFKFGQPNVEPDWFSFSIDELTQADWDIDQPGNWALSNTALWGDSSAPSSVPAPMSLGLMAAGLAGFGAAGRRRRS